MDEPVHPSITTIPIWWEDVKAHIPVYMITGDSRMLIDTGPPQRTPGSLAAALAPFGARPADIGSALLTHGHIDHVGGLPELKAAGPLTVAIGKEDAFLLSDHSKAFDEFYSVGNRMLSGSEDLSEAKQGFLTGAGPEYTPDRLLSDGDAIDLGAGIELTAVHLPGHSPGSIGYYWEKEGAMVCGDAIPALSGPGGSLPIIMDLFQYRRSIARLLELPLQTLIFTHAYRGLRLGPSTVRRGSEIRQYLADAAETADRLMDILRKESSGRSGRSFLAVADQVIAGMPAEMGFVPLARQFTPQFSVSTIYWGFACIEAAG